MYQCRVLSFWGGDSVWPEEASNPLFPDDRSGCTYLDHGGDNVWLQVLKKDGVPPTCSESDKERQRVCACTGESSKLLTSNKVRT